MDTEPQRQLQLQRLQAGKAELEAEVCQLKKDLQDAHLLLVCSPKSLLALF